MGLILPKEVKTVYYEPTAARVDGSPLCQKNYGNQARSAPRLITAPRHS